VGVRGVVGVIEAVAAWIDEDGGKGARLSIGEHSYMLTGQLLLPAGR
jgi:hypothetical protein